MKDDARPGWDEGGEREEAHLLLREWRAPLPPPAIEEALRRAIRRRRAAGRRALWLPLAAALALVLGPQVWRLTHPRPSAPPTPAAPSARLGPPAQPLAAAPARMPPLAPLAQARAASESASSAPVARRRARPPSPAEPAGVLVEPGQAELLAQLARSLRAVRSTVPGASPSPVEVVPVDAAPPVQTMPPASVRVYQEEWRAVEGVWPSVHRSVPTSGR